jgi:hypothetical protein
MAATELASLSRGIASWLATVAIGLVELVGGLSMIPIASRWISLVG